MSARSCRFTSQLLLLNPHVHGFGTTVPVYEQELSVDDDIWTILYGDWTEED